MFRVSVTKQVEEDGVLIPVLLEVRLDGGRVEWAPADSPGSISADDSLELSQDVCSEILALPRVLNIIEREMRQGGAKRVDRLKNKFEKAEKIDARP